MVGTLTEEAAGQLGLTSSVRVYGGCDDTQSAAIGSGSVNEGNAHFYFGTSAWTGITISKNRKHKNGAVVIQSGDPAMNLLVGITESAGSNLEWIIEKFYKYEKNDPAVSNIYDFINRETSGIPPGSDHLIFTPWMLGERCPVSTTTTRGTIFNLGPEHNRGHMVNALLEGIGFNLKWILANIKHDFGYDPERIRAIGGGSVNDRWMQGIANITGKTIETIDHPTLAGTIGAAACAFVGSGAFKGFNEVDKIINVQKRFVPDNSISGLISEQFITYKRIYADLKKTYRKANRTRFSSNV
jgi:xylulokinase